MKRLGYLIAVMCSLTAAGNLLAQPVITEWARFYGANGTDRTHFVHTTNDGGFVLSGATATQGVGNEDFWLIKTDSEGEVEWERTYGGTDRDWGNSSRQTIDGGYMIVGYTKSFGAQGGGDAWAVKTDASGDTMWTLQYNVGNRYEEFHAFRQINKKFGGGYVFAGWVNESYPVRDALIVLTDSEGNPLWERVYGGAGEDEHFIDVTFTHDNSIVAVGATGSWSNGARDWLIVKTDLLGEQLWLETYGGAGDEWTEYVQPEQDGSIIVCGVTRSFGALDADGCFIKMSPTGNVLWSRLSGLPSYDTAFFIQHTTDGGFIVIGEQFALGPAGRSMYFWKTDANANIEWDYGTGGTGEDWCWGGAVTYDGCYVGTAFSSSGGDPYYDGCLVKVCAGSSCEPSHAVLTPDELNFGVLETGETASRFFAIQNPDTCNLIVTNISSPVGYTTDFSEPLTVGPGGSVAIQVTFSPQEIREYNGFVYVHSNAQESPASLAVRGAGGGAQLLLEPDSLLFGEVLVGGEASMLLRLVSAGTLPVTVSNIYVPEGFSTDFSGLVTIPPGQESTIMVTFAPMVVGVYHDVLVAVGNTEPQTTVGYLLGTGSPLDAADVNYLVTEFALNGIYPNPFNPATTISFSLPVPSEVRLIAYDITGREVAQLVSGSLSAGRHRVNWNCPDCSAGIYFIAMEAGGFREVAKAVFVK